MPVNLTTTVFDVDEANRLYAYHLQMAAMYFEATSIPVNLLQDSMPLHAMPAAQAFTNALEKYYSDLDEEENDGS